MRRKRRKHMTTARIVRGAIGLTDDQCAEINARINARYDFSKIYEGMEVIRANEEGVFILDPNNSSHRKWMED